MTVSGKPLAQGKIVQSSHKKNNIVKVKEATNNRKSTDSNNKINYKKKVIVAEVERQETKRAMLRL